MSRFIPRLSQNWKKKPCLLKTFYHPVIILGLLVDTVKEDIYTDARQNIASFQLWRMKVLEKRVTFSNGKVYI